MSHKMSPSGACSRGRAEMPEDQPSQEPRKQGPCLYSRRSTGTGFTSHVTQRQDTGDRKPTGRAWSLPPAKPLHQGYSPDRPGREQPPALQAHGLNVQGDQPGQGKDCHRPGTKHRCDPTQQI